MKTYLSFLSLAILVSCTSLSPNTWVNEHNNMFTPDRLGIGISNGRLNALGLSNKFMPNQAEVMETDWDGDFQSTSIWLEWDIPQWPDNYSSYEQYLRDRTIIRRMLLEADTAEEPSDEQAP